MKKSVDKKILGNAAFTIGSALLLNGILQVIVNPLLNRMMGSEQFGVQLYIMGMVAILCPSVGQALNTSRLVVRRTHAVENGDYNTLLLLFGSLGTAVVLILSAGSLQGGREFVLAAMLFMATIFRYYGDVEYRLNLNYQRYFIYYAIISAGYLLGLVLYYITGIWYLVFLIGESAGIAYLAVKGTVFRRFWHRSGSFSVAFQRGGFLVFSYLVTNLTLNIDRVALKYFIGDLAVTQYYVVSLIGKTMVLLVAPVNTIIISYLTKKKENISRSQYLKFVGIGFGVSLVFLLLAQIGTPLFVWLFYRNLYESVKPLMTIVNITQVLGMLSGYLFIVVLTFTKELWQLVLQLVHLAVLLALILIFTGPHGIMGFAVAVLVANTIRVILVVILGLKKV